MAVPLSGTSRAPEVLPAAPAQSASRDRLAPAAQLATSLPVVFIVDARGRSLAATTVECRLEMIDRYSSVIDSYSSGSDVIVLPVGAGWTRHGRCSHCGPAPRERTPVVHQSAGSVVHQDSGSPGWLALSYTRLPWSAGFVVHQNCGCGRLPLSRAYETSKCSGCSAA